jgi:hypothetical protein
MPKKYSFAFLKSYAAGIGKLRKKGFALQDQSNKVRPFLNKNKGYIKSFAFYLFADYLKIL